MNDRKSWQVKNEAILDDLVALMDLTAQDKSFMTALQPQAQEIAPALSEAFYTRLLAHPATAEYVSEHIEDRKQALQGWFLELFGGEYGQAYVQSRLAIGQVHVRIGLPVRYPLAMMDVILEFGEKVTAQSSQSLQAATAFRKLLALDVAIFNQSYEDAQLEHLAEMVGNERLARRLLTQ